MAGGTEGKSDLSKVSIPGDVFQRLQWIADLVRANVSHAACERAGLREGGDQANLVTEDDVLLAASEVLRETATKLDRELIKRAGHVQVRNAS